MARTFAIGDPGNDVRRAMGVKEKAYQRALKKPNLE